MQQQGQQQQLGWDRGPTALGEELAEAGVEPIKGLSANRRTLRNG